MRKGINKGEKNTGWKGGKSTHKGYILIRMPEHPNALPNGYVKEHRLIMEKHIGRYLRNDEEIHHINKNRSDNRIENLIIITKAEHTRIHIQEKWDSGRMDSVNFNHTKNPSNGRFVSKSRVIDKTIWLNLKPYAKTEMNQRCRQCGRRNSYYNLFIPREAECGNCGHKWIRRKDTPKQYMR